MRRANTCSKSLWCVFASGDAMRMSACVWAGFQDPLQSHVECDDCVLEAHRKHTETQLPSPRDPERGAVAVTLIDEALIVRGCQVNFGEYGLPAQPVEQLLRRRNRSRQRFRDCVQSSIVHYEPVARAVRLPHCQRRRAELAAAVLYRAPLQRLVGLVLQYLCLR